MERALLEKESLKKDMAETEGARRASGGAPGMGAGQEVRVLWGPRRREPRTEDKGCTARWVRRKSEVKCGPERK